MTWITTALKAGPLAGDSYNMAITGLSASTKYQYRAYFVADGIAYYGNILSGTTAALTYTIPTVNTGGLFHPPSTTGFSISGNTITNNGNSPILEYGLLYTQLAAWGTDAALICANYPTYVKLASKISDIPTIPYTYTTGTTGLASNTNTYYRAFAKNAFGIGYGNIKTQLTAVTPPPLTINVDVEITWNYLSQIGLTDGFDGTYRLRCCTGANVFSTSVPLCSKSSISNWTVPHGCYYVDFSGLRAVVNSVSIPWDINWSIGHINGYACNTSSFNSNVYVVAELPLVPV